MRARIATVAALVGIGILVTPAAIAAECSLVDQVFERCQETSEPPPPEPTPEPQPAPTPEPEPQPAPAPQPQPQPQANPGHRAAAVERILARMNDERRAHKLPLLALRADVSAIAAPHSEAMAAKGTIWHNDAYFTAAVKKRLNARLLGENVARNTDIDDAHRRLMNSPGHRANILDARFTVVGIAVYDDGWGNLYVTQNFVQPATAPASKSAAAAPVEAPRSIPSTTQPPAPTTTSTSAAPEPAPAVLSAAPEAEVAPAQSTEEPAAKGPNPALLGIVALLALGSIATYALRARLHFLVPAADR